MDRCESWLLVSVVLRSFWSIVFHHTVSKAFWVSNHPSDYCFVIFFESIVVGGGVRRVRHGCSRVGRRIGCDWAAVSVRGAVERVEGQVEGALAIFSLEKISRYFECMWRESVVSFMEVEGWKLRWSVIIIFFHHLLKFVFVCALQRRSRAERSGLLRDNRCSEGKRQVEAADRTAHSAIFQVFSESVVRCYQCAAGFMRGRGARGQFFLSLALRWVFRVVFVNPSWKDVCIIDARVSSSNHRTQNFEWRLSERYYW